MNCFFFFFLCGYFLTANLRMCRCMGNDRWTVKYASALVVVPLCVWNVLHIFFMDFGTKAMSKCHFSVPNIMLGLVQLYYLRVSVFVMYFFLCCKINCNISLGKLDLWLYFYVRAILLVRRFCTFGRRCLHKTQYAKDIHSIRQTLLYYSTMAIAA